MGAARFILVGVVALLVATACGSGGLTDTERLWCSSNKDAVLGAAPEVLFDGDLSAFYWSEIYQGMIEEARDEFGEDLGDLDQVHQEEMTELLYDFLRRDFPSEWERVCRAAYVPDTHTTTTITTEASAEEDLSRYGAMLEAFRDAYPEYSSYTNEEVYALMQGVCGEIEAGTDPRQYIREVGADDTGLVLSVMVACPEWKDVLNEIITGE